MFDRTGLVVDLDELRLVVGKLRALRSELDDHPVRDLEPPLADFGHAGLAQATVDFCHRWQTGVKQLSDDARGTEERLSATVDTYSAADQVAAAAFDQVEEQFGG